MVQEVIYKFLVQLIFDINYCHGSWDIDLVTDNGPTAAEDYRAEVLHSDSDKRERQPATRPAEPKVWRKNMFVIKQVDHEEKQKIDGTKSLSPTRPNLYQILRVDSGANSLECLELQTGVLAYLNADTVVQADLPTVVDAESDLSSFLVSPWQLHKRRKEFLPVFKFFSEDDDQAVFDQQDSSADIDSGDVDISDLPPPAPGLGPILPEMNDGAARPGLRPRPALGSPIPPDQQTEDDEMEIDDEDEVLTAGAQDADSELPPEVPRPPPHQPRVSLDAETRGIVKEALTVIDDEGQSSRSSLKRLLEPAPPDPVVEDVTEDTGQPAAPPPVKRSRKVWGPASRQSPRIAARTAPPAQTATINRIVLSRPGQLPSQVLQLCQYLLNKAPSPLANCTKFELCDWDHSTDPALTNLGLSNLHWLQNKQPKKSCLKDSESTNTARKSVNFNQFGLYYREDTLICDPQYRGFCAAFELTDHSLPQLGCLASIRNIVKLMSGENRFKIDSCKEILLLTDPDPLN